MTRQAGTSSSMQDTLSHVIYEQPLHERMRVMLRLEHLFAAVEHAREGTSPWAARMAVSHLIELADITGRSDVRLEMIKELERIGTNLKALSDRPDVDSSRLSGLLGTVHDLVARLQAANGSPAQVMLASDMVANLKRRQQIAAANCDFDQPAFHFWLARPGEQRARDLNRWAEPFTDLRDATRLILGLVRDACAPVQETATSGFFQKSLDAAQPYQLVRVMLAPQQRCYPEISAGRHRFTVRFLEFGEGGGVTNSSDDVPFRLMCCTL